jgi:hypothetical protein
MRGEVLVGPERRRRWSEDQKARLIEESFRPGAQVANIARRYGVSHRLLYTWRWAILASLIETCKVNGIDPQAYLTAIFTRIANNHPINRIWPTGSGLTLTYALVDVRFGAPSG